jgi:hypothetical protein
MMGVLFVDIDAGSISAARQVLRLRSEPVERVHKHRRSADYSPRNAANARCDIGSQVADVLADALRRLCVDGDLLGLLRFLGILLCQPRWDLNLLVGSGALRWVRRGLLRLLRILLREPIRYGLGGGVVAWHVGFLFWRDGAGQSGAGPRRG